MVAYVIIVIILMERTNMRYFPQISESVSDDWRVYYCEINNDDWQRIFNEIRDTINFGEGFNGLNVQLGFLFLL